MLGLQSCGVRRKVWTGTNVFDAQEGLIPGVRESVGVLTVRAKNRTTDRNVATLTQLSGCRYTRVPHTQLSGLSRHSL